MIERFTHPSQTSSPYGILGTRDVAGDCGSLLNQLHVDGFATRSRSFAAVNKNFYVRS